MPKREDKFEAVIKQDEWIIKNDLKKLKDKCDEKEKVNKKTLKEKLRGSKSYYINEKGLSVNKNGFNVLPNVATYMLGILDGMKTKGGEQLYAWETKGHDGKFRNITYGTRRDFDKEIVDREQNKTKKI